MKIAFLMDPLENINPEFETTSHLIYECYRRGHQIYFLEPYDLYVRNNIVVGRMHEISSDRELTLHQYWQEAIKCVQSEEHLYEAVEDLDAMFLRKNPPLLYEVMELLAAVEQKVFMINSIRGQILGNSKLYMLNFPDLTPETHVSRDPDRLRKVIDNFGGTMVIKPLQRYGGEGVIKISAGDPENLSSLINYYVRAYEPYPRREPIMVQEYIDGGHSEGDIRVLMLNGKVIGAMRRVPNGTDFRANIHAGGTVQAHKLTVEEQAICNAVSKRLVQDGLYFVGLDLIGGKLIEVNCISPGGIPRINHLYGVKLEEQVIDFVEAHCPPR